MQIASLAALRVPNFRLFFIGQALSVSGVWMQTVAVSWLAWQLSGSGLVLGLVTAAEFLPVLLLSSFGGLAADRTDKWALLLKTQIVAAVIAGCLAAVTLFGILDVRLLAAFAALAGLARAVETPTRHTFVFELVGEQYLTNAITLQGVLFNMAKVGGPALAGFLIASGQAALCFLINAVSYFAIILGLLWMDRSRLQRVSPATRAPKQLREGLAYVWKDTRLRASLVVAGIVGTLALEWQVTLPIFADESLRGGPELYGLLLMGMGMGAVVGGVIAAGASSADAPRVMASGWVLGAIMSVAALAPNKELAMIAMVPLGAANVLFISSTNAALQLGAASEYRGRVMALYTMAFIGSTPLGAPIVGAIGEAFGGRVALGVTGLLTCAACTWGWRRLRGADVERRPASATRGLGEQPGAGVADRRGTGSGRCP